MINSNLIAHEEAFQQERKSDPALPLKSIPIEAYEKWYSDTYIKQLPQIKHKYDVTKGGLSRLSTLSVIKYRLLFNMIHGDIVVFKLYDYSKRKEINYSMIFAESVNEVLPDAKKSMAHEVIYGKSILQYYTCNGSFISCDGEYRSGFTRYLEIINAKLLFPEIWNELDAYVTSIMSKRMYTVHAQYFHGNPNRDENDELERLIKSEGIPIQQFIISWFIIMYHEYLGIVETHLNAAFREVMLAHSTYDVAFIKALVNKYRDTIGDFYHKITTYSQETTKKKVRYIPMGIKLLPLNNRELQDNLKIKYRTWKEYFIGNKLNDLIANNIAGGFPISCDWFLIKNTSKGLFDNKSQYARLKDSELARDILAKLHDAKNSTYFSNATLTDSKLINDFVSNKFKRLHDKISDSINYTVDELCMSSVTIAIPSEYVGRTFADIVSSSVMQKRLGNPFQPNHYPIFAKYVFEICYSMLACNKHLHILHGDFHLNNATIGELYEPTEKTCICYIADETYVFENNGFSACMIDFSRAIVEPNHYSDLADASIPHKLVDDWDAFAKSEQSSALHLYLQLYPNKSADKDRLQHIFKSSFEAVFKLLTAADIYMWCIRFSTALQAQKISGKCIKLLESIAATAEKFLATEMNNLISDDKYASDILEGPWPLQSCITKHFSEFVETPSFAKFTCVDAFSLDNSLRYNTSLYEKFPSVLRDAYYTENDKLIPIKSFMDIRKTRRTTYEKKKQLSIEDLRFISTKSARESDVYRL